jgi:MFS transporter, DHA1 family, staphyloferrin A biosynthesis exporter
VREDRTILLLVLVALVPTFFGHPYMTLLAVFAEIVHGVGPLGLGLMTSSAALGAVGGGLLLAALPRAAVSGRAMLGFLAAFGALLCAFALNPAFLLAPILLVGVGMMQIAYGATNNTILQTRVPDRMRGRVMSILLLNRGLVQLGAAFGAALAGLIGAPTGLALAGGVIVVFAALVWWRSAQIRAIGGGDPRD